MWYKGEFLFCKPTDGRATSLEVFNITNHFLEENKIKWVECTELCIDGVQSISEWNAGLQILGEINCLILSGHTVCFTERHLHQEISEDLQTIFQAIIRVVNRDKNSPLRRKLFAKLCDVMEAEHKAFLCYYTKVFHRVFELKEDSHFCDSNNSDYKNLFYYDFIQKLVYLVDISDNAK
jgi:hypothetical protein